MKNEIIENEIFEIIKIFKLRVNNTDFYIEGRILQIMKSEELRSGEYIWEISHYCKQFESAAEVYIPSSIQSKTAEEAERLLFYYMKNFRNLGIIANKSY